MKHATCVIVNVALNAFIVVGAPLLVLTWLVRVHAIEYLQGRRRSAARTVPAARAFEQSTTPDAWCSADGPAHRQ